MDVAPAGPGDQAVGHLAYGGPLGPRWRGLGSQGVGGGGQHLVHARVPGLGGRDQQAEAVHRHVADLAEDPQQAEPPAVRLVVLGETRGDLLSCVQQPLAEVELDGRHGHARGLRQLRDAHGPPSNVLTGSDDSATVVLDTSSILETRHDHQPTRPPGLPGRRRRRTTRRPGRPVRRGGPHRGLRRLRHRDAHQPLAADPQLVAGVHRHAPDARRAGVPRRRPAGGAVLLERPDVPHPPALAQRRGARRLRPGPELPSRPRLGRVQQAGRREGRRRHLPRDLRGAARPDRDALRQHAGVRPGRRAGQPTRGVPAPRNAAHDRLDSTEPEYAEE